MSEFLQQLLQWIAEHPGLSSGAVFLVALAESLAFVGLILPGVAIMFGLGALIANGAIPFWPAIAAATAGAILGDSISYWVGRRYQNSLNTRWPFCRYPEQLERATGFFQRYGGKSVAFGRFFGPVRGIIPLVAGTLGMSGPRFVIASVLSAMAWAPAYLLPGMVFGASLELASEVAFRLVAIGLMLLLLGWLLLRLVRGLFRLLQPHATALAEAILRSGQRHRLLREMAAALSDPAHPEARGLALLASLMILATASFVLLLGLAPGGGMLQALDQLVLQALQSLRSPLGDHLMVGLTRLADAPVLVTVALGCLLFFLWSGHRRTAYYWLTALLFSLLVSPLLKLGLAVPRPQVALLPPDSYSFPSGHTLKAAVIYGFLAVIIARPLPGNSRWLPYAIASLLTLGVALSRLYLGVHWLSDVLGSIALGGAWVAALGLAYHRHLQAETHWRGLLLVAGLTLLLAFSGTSWLQHQDKLQRYTPAVEQRSAQIADWWDQAALDLPEYRQDLSGSNDQPLNIQYAGPLPWLEARLAEAGWQRAEAFSWPEALKLLAPSKPIASLPTLPQVHNGRHELLTMVKNLDDTQRLTLRLWPSQVALEPGAVPLWLGSVALQEKRITLNLLAYPRTTTEFTAPLNRLGKDLAILPSSQFSRHYGRALIRHSN